MNDQQIEALFGTLNIVLNSVELFARGEISQAELAMRMEEARDNLILAENEWEDAAQPNDTQLTGD